MPRIELFICVRPDCGSTNLRNRTLKTEAKTGLFVLRCRECGTFQGHEGLEAHYKRLHNPLTRLWDYIAIAVMERL